MRIAIIGAGISGLTFYLWLRKLDLLDEHEVTIYERRPPPPHENTGSRRDDAVQHNSSNIGGSLGIMPNGLHVLRRLDEDLHADIMRAGCRETAFRISNARGWTLVEMKWPKPALEESRMLAVMIGRDDFWHCLRRRVPDEVIFNKKLISIEHVESRGRVLRFDDGSEVTADLVIGADGIWSGVRKHIFSGESQPHRFDAHYEGLVGVGGFVRPTLLEGVSPDEANFVLGRNGFFGYAWDRGLDNPYGSRGICWSTYSLDELPSDWRKIDVADAQRQIRERHKDWQNDVVQRLIKEVQIDQVWPTYTVPPLPTWEDGKGCVLVGDAAHALQPSSGQGASMALEDCETLARFLAHYLAQEQRPVEAVSLACKQYCDMRMPRVAEVYKRGQRTGSMKQDMGVVAEFAMYLFVWLMGVFGIGNAYNHRIWEYDVETAVGSALQKQRR